MLISPAPIKTEKIASLDRTYNLDPSILLPEENAELYKHEISWKSRFCNGRIYCKYVFLIMFLIKIEEMSKFKAQICTEKDFFC